MPLDPEPRPTQHQHVGPAVVVVIGLHDVESARFPDQTGFLRAIGESPVTVVVEIAQLIVHTERGNHNVQIAVTVEVLDNCPARQ